MLAAGCKSTSRSGDGWAREGRAVGGRARAAITSTSGSPATGIYVIGGPRPRLDLSNRIGSGIEHGIM